MTRTTIMFDMRASSFGAPWSELYPAAIEMAEFADQAGFDRVILNEHHGSEDGYLPSPFVLGGAIAARTKKLRVCLSAVILPLHDPVTVAENTAVLDLISGGRLEVVIGAGYVPSEFARFGVSLRDRGRLLDEGVDLILRALAGERFQANGKEVFVRPLPVQDPHQIVMAGGGAEASAKRAARFDIGFMPLRAELLATYETECQKYKRKPRLGYQSSAPLAFFVSEDPKAAWTTLEPYMIHVAKVYAQWESEGSNSSSPFAGLQNPEVLRASGMYKVFTPDECVEFVQNKASKGLPSIMQPLLGGLPPSLGWKSLKLFTEKVLPRLATSSR